MTDSSSEPKADLKYVEVDFGGETGDINLQVGYEDRNKVCEKEDVLAKKKKVCKVHLV